MSAESITLTPNHYDKLGVIHCGVLRDFTVVCAGDLRTLADGEEHTFVRARRGDGEAQRRRSGVHQALNRSGAARPRISRSRISPPPIRCPRPGLSLGTGQVAGIQLKVLIFHRYRQCSTRNPST